MKIKYFVSDLDGTIIFKDHVKEKDIYAIHDFEKEGNHFWVATGRPYKTYEILKTYDLFPEKMVCSSGAVIWDNKMNIDYVDVIDTDTARHLFQYLDENFPHLDYHLDTSDEEHHIGRMLSGNMKRHMERDKVHMSNQEIEDRDMFFQYRDIKLLRIFAVGDDNAYCYAVQKGLEEEFHGKIIALKTDEACIDILPSTCGKWHGLLKLLEKENIDPSCVASIGDEETDAEMLQNCGLGFAMSHADKIVKDAADYVVDSVEEALNIIKDHNKGW